MNYSKRFAGIIANTIGEIILISLAKDSSFFFFFFLKIKILLNATRV